MDNLAIARIFSEIADLLEIKSENPFKIRAYRNASDTIAHATERVAHCTEEQLRAIPGIGKELASKIREIAETGEVRYHRDLLEQFPPTILDLLHLQGVGPKTVAQLYTQLGIRTVDELEAACRDGRVRELKGMGSKKEQLILKACAERKQHSGRHLLPDAAEAAAMLVDYLRTECPAAAFVSVGSLRRGADTSGDIDILATGTDPHVMTTFTTYTLVDRVLGHGDTKSSVLLWGGIQADLRLVPEESQGAAMQYFTGSKSHNIALRDRAMARGLKLNEYGLFQTADNALVAGRTEAEIYEALGLAEIPPELREGRGEIDAAEQRRLPSLITLADIRGDIHSHTTETDGRDDIETMAIAAREAGLSYLAITDHSKALAMANGLDEDRALAHAKRVREIGRRLDGITLLAGIECDIRPDGTHGSRRRLPRAARRRHRLGALGLQSGRFADDRPHASRSRLPLRRHHRPSDRAASTEARAVQGRRQRADRRCGSHGRGARDQLAGRSPRSIRHTRQGRSRSGCEDRHQHRLTRPGRLSAA